MGESAAPAPVSNEESSTIKRVLFAVLEMVVVAAAGILVGRFVSIPACITIVALGGMAMLVEHNGRVKAGWSSLLLKASRNPAASALIVIALIAGVVMLNPLVRLSDNEELILTVSNAAYNPNGSSTLKVIASEEFKDQMIPLDGYFYQNTTFTNVCFKYGGGPYALQNVTLKQHWRVCVKERRLKNYAELMGALHLMRPGVTKDQREEIKQP